MLLLTSIVMKMNGVAKLEPWIDSTFARKHRLTARLLPATEGSWSWLPSVREIFQTYVILAGQMSHLSPSVEERRYPFLDQTLAEFLMSIPTDQVLRPGERRSLMRRALARLLPPEVLARRTKAGTGRCLTISLEKHWNRLENTLRSPLCSRLGYVNNDRFHAAISGLRNGKMPRHVVLLLRVVSLELWLRDAAARGVISIPPLLAQDIGPEFAQSTTHTVLQRGGAMRDTKFMELATSASGEVKSK